MSPIVQDTPAYTEDHRTVLVQQGLEGGFILLGDKTTQQLGISGCTCLVQPGLLQEVDQRCQGFGFHRRCPWNRGSILIYPGEGHFNP